MRLFITRNLRRFFSATSQLKTNKPSGKSNRRLILEVLEDRWVPSTTTTYLADGVVSGSVMGGGQGLGGVNVSLVGTTLSGTQVSYSATTNHGGAFTFSSVLPGNYQLSNNVPNGFLNTGLPITGISLSQGQILSNQNLSLSGLVGNHVSLISFESDVNNAVVSNLKSVPLPAAGSGGAVGFSLNSANPLSNQTITAGTPSYLNLASYFMDPNTSNPVVTINTTLGAIKLELYAKDAPATVTNFLDYIQSGNFNNSIFNRLSNLSQTGSMSPMPTPYQVLQGGGFNFKADSSNNVTGFGSVSAFQSIPNESNDTVHPNAAGTIAMARSSAVNSGTNQFFFNLTNNTSALGNTPGNGYTVFGKVADQASMNILTQYASQFTPNDQTSNASIPSNISSNFYSLPLKNGFAPDPHTAGAGLGATSSQLAAISNISVPTLTGQLTYSNIKSSNSAITVTMGTNTNGSAMSADQMEISAAAGTATGTTSTVTFTVSDAKGDSVNYSFVVTVH